MAGVTQRGGRRGAAIPLLALASALAIASGAARAFADEADEAVAPSASTNVRPPSALHVSFFDDFLGLPKGRLRDDNGFVANLRITAELPQGDRELLRVGVSQQLITERGGFDRVDDGMAYASWQRFLGPSPDRGPTIGWTVGLRVVGDLGGSIMQDWAHRALFTGRHLDGQGVSRLQYRYPRGYDVLGDLGGLAKMVHPLGGPWSVEGGIEGSLGLGTGYFGELHPFVGVAFTTRFLEIELRQGSGIYATNIRPLTMPGAYVTRVLESQPALHAALLGPRSFPSTLAFDLQWNQGNSHQHVGGFTVGARF
jgi:hypothetical protein